MSTQLAEKVVHESARIGDQYRDCNAELFGRRQQLLDQIAGLEPSADSDVAVDHALQVLRRRLDDVTREVVTYNRGLVRTYCSRFTKNSNRDDRADFEAAGMLGLMRAIDSFDPRQGRFGHWAFKPIQREVLRAVHSADHHSVSMGDFERRPEILRVLHRLQELEGERAPTVEEVAAAAHASASQVRRVLSPPRVESIHQAVGDDGVTLGDTLESAEIGPESAVLARLTLSALQSVGLAALEPRELFVVVRRFGLDGEPEAKLGEIGASLGLSREAVRQIEAKAIAKIQHPMVLRRLQRFGKE